MPFKSFKSEFGEPVEPKDKRYSYSVTDIGDKFVVTDCISGQFQVYDSTVEMQNHIDQIHEEHDWINLGTLSKHDKTGFSRLEIIQEGRFTIVSEVEDNEYEETGTTTLSFTVENLELAKQKVEQVINRWKQDRSRFQSAMKLREWEWTAQKDMSAYNYRMKNVVNPTVFCSVVPKIYDLVYQCHVMVNILIYDQDSRRFYVLHAAEGLLAAAKEVL